MGKVNPNPKPCPCMLNPGTEKRTSTELFAARNTPCKKTTIIFKFLRGGYRGSDWGY